MPDISAVYLLIFIPVGLVLLLRADWAFYAFMVGLPLEMLIVDQFLTLPKILGLIALVSFLLSTLTQRRKIKTDRVFWILGIYLNWCILSYFWSVDPYSSLIRIATIFQVTILYLLVINQIESEVILGRTMIAISIGAAILATSGVFELLAIGAPNQRLAGIARNANWYFVVAICSIPAFYWLIVNHRYFAVKLYAFLILGALFITGINTQSRGGLVSLGVFLSAYLAFTDKKVRWLFISAVIVLIGFQIMPPGFIERFAVVGHENVDRFTYLWPAAWHAFTMNMWKGYGIGTSDLIVPWYLFGYSGQMSPHNSLLAIGIDTGVPGVLLYLSSVLIPTFGLLSAVKKSSHNTQRGKLQHFGLLLFCVLLAYMASWFKGGGMEYQKLLWVFVGLESSILNLLDVSTINQTRANVEVEIYSHTLKRQILSS